MRNGKLGGGFRGNRQEKSREKEERGGSGGITVSSSDSHIRVTDFAG